MIKDLSGYHVYIILTGTSALFYTLVFTVAAVYRVNDPIYTAWINQGLDTKVRATVLSANSQANALGQVVGGPILGAIGNVLSIGVAIVSAGLVLSPVMGLYLLILRKGKIAK